MDRAPVACVVNLGCRVNRVESDRMSIELAGAGFASGAEDAADVVIINTCAVTGEAEAKTRKAVRRALARVGEPTVIVTGCAVSLRAGELQALSERLIVEPAKDRVVERAVEIVRSVGERIPVARTALAAGEVRTLLGRARVGVKVQDGCDNRCAYCVVWRARGPARCVPRAAVLARVREIAAAGVPEVVLTGVNLGAYGADGADIADLLDTVLRETDIAHVRLSSIEPGDVSDRLLEIMAGDPMRVAPFLHIPLQSGCTATLRRMDRPYGALDFERLAQRVRTALPAASISCDVIVGFPGESDAEFEASLALCERVGFSRMHVFRFSARPGTRAAAAPDQIAPERAASRSRRMRSLAERSARADAAGRIGTRERAVPERGRIARLGSFHRIVIDGSDASHALPAIASVDIVDMDAAGMLHGRIAGTPVRTAK